METTVLNKAADTRSLWDRLARGALCRLIDWSQGYEAALTEVHKTEAAARSARDTLALAESAVRELVALHLDYPASFPEDQLPPAVQAQLPDERLRRTTLPLLKLLQWASDSEEEARAHLNYALCNDDPDVPEAKAALAEAEQDFKVAKGLCPKAPVPQGDAGQDPGIPF